MILSCRIFLTFSNIKIECLNCSSPLPSGSLSLRNSSAGWVFSNIFRHTLRFQDVLINQSVVRQHKHLERFQNSLILPILHELSSNFQIIPDCSSFFPFSSQHLIFIQGVWNYISSDDSKKAKLRGYSRCLCYFVL